MRLKGGQEQGSKTTRHADQIQPDQDQGAPPSMGEKRHWSGTTTQARKTSNKSSQLQQWTGGIARDDPPRSVDTPQMERHWQNDTP